MEAGEISAPVGTEKDALEAAAELEEIEVSFFKNEIWIAGVVLFALVEVGEAIEHPFVFGILLVPLGGEVVGLIPRMKNVDGDEVGLDGADDVVLGFEVDPLVLVLVLLGLVPNAVASRPRNPPRVSRGKLIANERKADSGSSTRVARRAVSDRSAVLSQARAISRRSRPQKTWSRRAAPRI